MKKIYIDGSNRKKINAGGWSVVIMNKDETQIIEQIYDTEENVTNNQMELKALLVALQYAEDNPDDYFVIYSDSAYVVNAYNTWIPNWAQNGWINSKKQIVENLEYMKALYTYIKRDFFNAEVCKCAGHSGEVGNELADALATGNKNKYDELCETWFELK